MIIGCIGLGRMGSGVCQSIIRKGYKVWAYDINPQAALAFEGKASIAHSLVEIRDICDCFIVSLPGSIEVEQLVNEMLSYNISGKVIIDISTSFPGSTKKLAGKVCEAGGVLLDVPLAGTPASAAEGKLSVYVGGSREGYERVEEIIKAFAENIQYMGDSGSGNIAKLVNNYLAIMYCNLYAEIFPLAESLGMDPTLLFESISKTGVACMPYKLYAKKIVEREYPISFSVDLACKDMTYVALLAEEAGVELPLLTQGLGMLVRTSGDGMGGLDISVAAENVRRLFKR